MFISHRQSDREFATALAIFFKSIGLDYYFDEQDEVLSSLVAQGHKYEESVVLSIDHGLDHSTHLLGLITAQTRGSWWVPYEIGGARGRGQATMYALFHDMIPDDVPEYVKISPIERSRSRLAKWAEELAGWPANLLGSQGASASPDQQRATIMHERNRAMAGLSSFMLE